MKQAQILTAEGEKQSAILRAEGQKQAAILQAEGQAKAIDTVFRAIHEGDADPKLLAYQYLQVLPEIAQGESNKVWIIPSEVTQALGQLTAALPRRSRTTGRRSRPARRGRPRSSAGRVMFVCTPKSYRSSVIVIVTGVPSCAPSDIVICSRRTRPRGVDPGLCRCDSAEPVGVPSTLV